MSKTIHAVFENGVLLAGKLRGESVQSASPVLSTEKSTYVVHYRVREG